MMKKRKRTAILSLGYWFGAHSLGLLLHPYQSMRKVVRDELYRPLVWLPMVSLLAWWVLGFLVSRLSLLAGVGLGIVANGLERWGASQIVLSFGFVWVMMSLALWQILLVYLYRRFNKVLR